MFVIDGTEYNGYACLVDGLTESFALVEGFSSQRLQSGDMWYDIIGTETSHTVVLRRSPDISIQNWEALWTLLKSPVDYHTFTFPCGQSTITYRGHISSGSRSLESIVSGVNYFGDYTINITPAVLQNKVSS